MADLEKQFAAYAKDLAENLAPGVDLERPPRTRSDSERMVWERMHPNNYHLRFAKAEELIDAGKWSEAQPLIEKLAADYSGESGADNPLWLLATVHRNLGDTNAEFATLRKFAEQESGFVLLYVRLIELSELRQDWAALADYAERLLALNPLISLPHRALARAGVEMNRPDTAIAGYEKLLRLDPPDPADVHFQLARLLHGQGRAPGDARRHVLRALEEAPRFRAAQELLLKMIDGSPANPAESRPVTPDTAAAPGNSQRNHAANAPVLETDTL
jgi:tetratricopeptide (TPR) repeat protein